MAGLDGGAEVKVVTVVSASVERCLLNGKPLIDFGC